jgi:hypothetical protein
MNALHVANLPQLLKAKDFATNNITLSGANVSLTTPPQFLDYTAEFPL